jgi:hypothetical protein
MCEPLQDTLGGALAAVFGIAFIAASLTITEALMVETDKKFSWGRSVRMMFASLCSVGMFWVSPKKYGNCFLHGDRTSD